MNLSSLLQVPWRSSHFFMRWLSAVFFALCSGGGIAFGVFATNAHHLEGAVGLYGVGLVYLWIFFFPTGLLLAIEARQLRLPGLQQQVVLSLLLYGLLGIGLPVAALALLGLPVFHAAIMLALSSVGGLALALVPRYVAVFFGLIPALFNALWLRFNLPAFGDPRFDRWAGLAILLVLAFDIVRWRQLLRTDARFLQGWSSPLVILARNGSWGRLSSLGDSRILRQSPDWLRMTVDLAGVGPAMPRKALRVALGGWYLPQTASSYARQLAWTLGLVLLPLAGALLLGRSGYEDAHAPHVLQGFFAGTLGVIAGPMVCLFSVLWLGRRWQRANAELPLLALLPGLGDSMQVKKQLLRAALGLPLAFHALLALLAGAAMVYWHGHTGLLTCMLAAQLGAAATTAAGVLRLFGGYGLKNWTTGLVLAAICVLSNFSVVLPVLAWGRYPEAWAVTSIPSLELAWLLLGGAMFWLGRRGWRGLMQLPHPFLSH